MASSMQDSHSANFIREHIGEIPTTLPVALHYLNLQPKFHVYTVCPKCSFLYSNTPELPTPTLCTQQSSSGAVCGTKLLSTHYRGGRTRQKPIMRYSHQRFDDWISELLLRPGVEDMLESTHPSVKSTRFDVWDAPYLSNLSVPGEPNFFEAPPGELRLAMLLFHDFFNPFGNKTAGKINSVGCFFMVCLNLPPDVRYDISYSYLASIVPGPSEAKMADLHNYIRPLADDMSEMFSPGIWISRTYKYPHGRKVRVTVPLGTMDTPAARAFGGFAPHSHTCFCYLCMATLRQIHHNDLSAFQLRKIDSHRNQVSEWLNATTASTQQSVYNKYGIRDSEWLRFPWWNPFIGMPVGPMHWTKNILDKHLRQLMGWSWDNSTGIPSAPESSKPVSELEYEWGNQAIMRLGSEAFIQSKLTSGLTRYLCRQRGIYEAGLSSEALMSELNEWRKDHGIIGEDGQLTPEAQEADSKHSYPVSVAKAHFYLSKATQLSQVESHASASDLSHLCTHFGLPSAGLKKELAQRLFDYHVKLRIQYLPDTVAVSHAKKVSVLGVDILAAVREDMGRTTLPRWLKHPPKNFAKVTHGKIQAEEYKSLAMVSFVITLVRLWGKDPTGAYRERLDHFLRLMLCVRILAFQSLTELDIQAFEHNFGLYLSQLTTLYPFDSRTSVQHMGLHIPFFLRMLGPSTRFSESTCELFNGILQEISTNFKFGDMELTMHREFIMASRLKGLLERDSLAQSLGDFGEFTRQFIRGRLPGCVRQGWDTNHSREPILVDNKVYLSLSSWATSLQTRPVSRRLLVCSGIQKGNLFYSPYTNSNGDSCILFCPPAQSSPIPGRIDMILQEPPDAVPLNCSPRILLLVRPFLALRPEDSVHDPYLNHPIIGRSGADLVRLYYDQVEDSSYILEPRDLVAHAAVCNYDDQKHTIPQACVVVLSLDLKHKRFA